MEMEEMRENNIFSMSIAGNLPGAYAVIQGGKEYPDIVGTVSFYRTRWGTGTMVEVELDNLPNSASYAPRFLGMHIHENGDCGNDFADTGMHYNPTGAVHPYHLGDLPPLLNSSGYAYMVFYDGYLEVEDILGRSIILHGKRDDFTSQPSGDSGDKIACGVIRS